MPLTPGTRLEGYEITALIGEGGMGQVYRARDTRLQRDVALKVLPDAFAADPERAARFDREAQALAALNHPNIAQIYDSGTVANAAGKPDVVFLVMELVAGDDPKVARDHLAQAAKALYSIPQSEAVKNFSDGQLKRHRCPSFRSAQRLSNGGFVRADVRRPHRCVQRGNEGGALEVRR